MQFPEEKKKKVKEDPVVQWKPQGGISYVVITTATNAAADDGNEL